MVGGQRHAPAALLQGKRPGTHCTGSWVGPRVGLDLCGNPCHHRDSTPGSSKSVGGVFERVHFSGCGDVLSQSENQNGTFQSLVSRIITLVAVLYFMSLLLGQRFGMRQTTLFQQATLLHGLQRGSSWGSTRYRIATGQHIRKICPLI